MNKYKYILQGKINNGRWFDIYSLMLSHTKEWYIEDMKRLHPTWDIRLVPNKLYKSFKTVSVYHSYNRTDETANAKIYVLNKLLTNKGDKKMKVQNMTSNRSGRDVPNQFIITTDKPREVFFQSYDSIIVRQSTGGKIALDSKYWDYSVTTGKYRNQFLGETKKETEAKIKSGEYILTDLN